MGEYIKTETRKFAKLGYTTFAINVFEQLGYPEPTHIVSGSQIQAKTPDPEFTRVLTEGWRFLLKQANGQQRIEWRSAVTAWAGASRFISSRRRRKCAPSSAIIPRCAPNPIRRSGRCIQP